MVVKSFKIKTITNILKIKSGNIWPNMWNGLFGQIKANFISNKQMFNFGHLL